MKPTDRVATNADVKAIGKSNRLKPKESDLIGKRGYKRHYREDGSYTWTYDYKPNDHGKPTREGAEAMELLRPSMRADAERLANRNPHAMDAFKPVRKGVSVMRTQGRTLWKLIDDQWMRIL